MYMILSNTSYTILATNLLEEKLTYCFMETESRYPRPLNVNFVYLKKIIYVKFLINVILTSTFMTIDYLFSYPSTYVFCILKMVVLFSVGNGRWRFDRCVPTADGRKIIDGNRRWQGRA